jgi:hypothetical protein
MYNNDDGEGGLAAGELRPPKPPQHTVSKGLVSNACQSACGAIGMLADKFASFGSRFMGNAYDHGPAPPPGAHLEFWLLIY